jgi:drug/metabolite transporter (DMT)-like permease
LFAGTTTAEIMALAPLLLAVAAAAGWGASDYFGGDASAHGTPALVVVTLSEGLGLVLLLPALIASGTPPADPRLLLAALAGVAVTVELGLIYYALGRGDAFITSAVGALGAAIAVSIGVAGGDALSPAITIGLLAALLGGAISCWQPSAGQPTGSVLQATGITVGAAVAVGAMLTCFHAAGQVDPTWAAAIERAATATSAGIAVLVAARRRGFSDARWSFSGMASRSQVITLLRLSAVGVAGDLAYAIASRNGALSTVSAISSLYPISTIALNRFLQTRRPNRIQAGGIVIALAGAVLLGAANQPCRVQAAPEKCRLVT